MASKLPKELRNDPEISHKLEELDHVTKTYFAFDMNNF